MIDKKSALPVIISVLTGLVIIAGSCSKDKRPDTTFPEMKMPYIALNMVLGTQLVITDDKEYLKKLEEESALSRKQIKKMFRYVLKNQTKDEVIKRAGEEIGNSLKELRGLPDGEKWKFFTVNILAPYLTMVVNNFDINDANEKEIQSIFAKLFDAPQDTANPLLELAEGSNRYHRGQVYKSKITYELNRYLIKKGICLDYGLRRSRANIFKIERVICQNKEWRPDEEISIFVLTRLYPNFLDGRLGYAPAEHSDVFIIKDLHHNRAKKYRDELRSKITPAHFSGDSYQKLWKSLGLYFDFERMVRIRHELLYKDLYGNSLSEIEKNFIAQTAVHEAKHRIDEIEMPTMRLNLDMEVSAYLTTAILAPYPFLGLRSTIEWTESYFHSTRYIKLKNLLADLWILADNSLKEGYTGPMLRAELLKIYENYTTIHENAKFINLTEFEQRMLPLVSKNL